MLPPGGDQREGWVRSKMGATEWLTPFPSPDFMGRALITLWVNYWTLGLE